MPPPQQLPIAIVGIGSMLPGSTDPEGFWADILAGKDLISDVPASRWMEVDYYDPDLSAQDKTYSRRGGFLAEVPFDPLAFGMPPSVLDLPPSVHDLLANVHDVLDPFDAQATDAAQ